MKQYKAFIASMILLLILGACSTAVTSNDTDMDLEEIIEKSIVAMSDLKSYSIEMTSGQTISIPGEEPFEMQMTMTSDIIFDPLQMYFVQEISALDIGEMDNITTETYFTDQGFYSKDSMSDTWIKYSDEFAEMLLGLQDLQMKPDEQLTMLKNFASQVDVKEDNSHYILYVDTNSENVRDMVKEVMGLMGDDMGMLAEIFDHMEIQTFSYVIYIDKTTFYQTKMDVDMEISVTFEGETMSTHQKMFSSISNFNGIESITVPQEAIDTAEELSMDGMFNFEDFDFDELELN